MVIYLWFKVIVRNVLRLFISKRKFMGVLKLFLKRCMLRLFSRSMSV